MARMPWKNKQPESEGGELTPLMALRGEMERLFDSFLREPLAAMDWSRWGSDKWSPAIELAENDKELTVRVELPGMVVVMGGHMRNFYGQVYLTDLLPAGVQPENLR